MDSNGFSRDQRDLAPLEQAPALVVQVDLQANGQGVWQQSILKQSLHAVKKR